MVNTNGRYAKLYSTFTYLRQNGALLNTSGGGALLGFNVMKIFENPDAIDPNVTRSIKTEQEHKPETGIDRLRYMFSYDVYGDSSPELQLVTEGAAMGFFIGAVIGGTIQSREAYLKFLETNQASIFHGHVDAKKRLQDKVTVGFLQGAWRWGWRLGLFTGGVSLFTTGISVYRGKSSIIEYLAGGAITGTLYKFKDGPKAMVSGGVLGGALGTIAGCLSLGLMYLTGTSMEDIRYWQYKSKADKQASKLARLNKNREEKFPTDPQFPTDPLINIQGHEQIVTSNMLDKIEVDSPTHNSQEKLSIPQQ